MDISVFNSADAWIALVTLTVLEIVLGIDNIIFISILSGKLPAEKQGRARNLGLGLAMITRVLLLLSISWIIRMDNDFMTIAGHGFSVKDIVLLTGGIFLMYKATLEIHEKIQGEEAKELKEIKIPTLSAVVFQIVLLDIVFSLDSVITAVGMVDASKVLIMIIAVIIAVLIMLFASGKVSAFVNRHPTIKMLALSFLVLIGVSLVVEGWGEHLEKGYIYFAMGFAVMVEMLNLRARKRMRKKMQDAKE